MLRVTVSLRQAPPAEIEPRIELGSLKETAVERLLIPKDYRSRPNELSVEERVHICARLVIFQKDPSLVRIVENQELLHGTKKETPQALLLRALPLEANAAKYKFALIGHFRSWKETYLAQQAEVKVWKQFLGEEDFQKILPLEKEDVPRSQEEQQKLKEKVMTKGREKFFASIGKEIGIDPQDVNHPNRALLMPFKILDVYLREEKEFDVPLLESLSHATGFAKWLQAKLKKDYPRIDLPEKLFKRLQNAESLPWALRLEIVEEIRQCLENAKEFHALIDRHFADQQPQAHTLAKQCFPADYMGFCATDVERHQFIFTALRNLVNAQEQIPTNRALEELNLLKSQHPANTDLIVKAVQNQCLLERDIIRLRRWNLLEKDLREIQSESRFLTSFLKQNVLYEGREEISSSEAADPRRLEQRAKSIADALEELPSWTEGMHLGPYNELLIQQLEKAKICAQAIEKQIETSIPLLESPDSIQRSPRVFAEGREEQLPKALRPSFDLYDVHPLGDILGSEGRWAVIDSSSLPAPHRQLLKAQLTPSQLEAYLKDKQPGEPIYLKLDASNQFILSDRPLKECAVLFYEASSEWIRHTENRDLGQRARLVVGEDGKFVRKMKEAKQTYKDWNPDRERTAAVDRLQMIYIANALVEKILRGNAAEIDANTVQHILECAHTIQGYDLARLPGSFSLDSAFVKAASLLENTFEPLAEQIKENMGLRIQETAKKRSIGEDRPLKSLMSFVEMANSYDEWIQSIQKYLKNTDSNLLPVYRKHLEDLVRALEKIYQDKIPEPLKYLVIRKENLTPESIKSCLLDFHAGRKKEVSDWEIEGLLVNSAQSFVLALSGVKLAANALAVLESSPSLQRQRNQILADAVKQKSAGPERKKLEIAHREATTGPVFSYTYALMAKALPSFKEAVEGISANPRLSFEISRNYEQFLQEGFEREMVRSKEAKRLIGRSREEILKEVFPGQQLS